MIERKIAQKVKGFPAVDGAGVKMTRVLSNQTMQAFDPFLMLDSFDSKDPADYTKGFPWHPHRGMETITYLIEGKIDHEDSLKNHGHIGAGGSQWMTAGSGILHQEMPKESDAMLGFQLWLNMPEANKMAPPAYHDITIAPENIVIENDVIIRVLSGNYKEKTFGFQPTFIEATIFDISLEANQSISLKNKAENTVFIFNIVNEVLIQAQIIEPKTAVLFGAGDQITVASTAIPARFIYFEAPPLHESIVWGGPIVMNTQEELRNAFDELDNGTFIK